MLNYKFLIISRLEYTIANAKLFIAKFNIGLNQLKGFEILAFRQHATAVFIC